MPLSDDPLTRLLIFITAIILVVNISPGIIGPTEVKHTETTIHQNETSPFSFPKYQVMASISAYNPIPDQTDNTPFINASGDRVMSGDIACPSWLPLGTIVTIEDKLYICKDRMGSERRNGNYFDIFMWELDDAIEFGRRNLVVTIYD